MKAKHLPTSIANRKHKLASKVVSVEPLIPIGDIKADVDLPCNRDVFERLQQPGFTEGRVFMVARLVLLPV
jgi:hypothetical protein